MTNPRRMIPIAIVGTVGVLGIVRAILWSQWSRDAVTMGEFAVIGSLIGGIIGLAVGFAIWVGHALVFQVVSGAFESEGSFRTMVHLVGFGFLPKVIESGAYLLSTVYFTMTTPRPSSESELTAAITSIESHWLGDTLEIASVSLILWSAFLWMLAIKHVRGISYRLAALSVSLPVVLTIGWRVLPYF